jgi:hypothetical protein
MIVGDQVETDNEGAEEGERFEHFDGFSYMGSGSLEVGARVRVMECSIGCRECACF